MITDEFFSNIYKGKKIASNQKCLKVMRDGRACGLPASISLGVWAEAAWVCPVHYQIEQNGMKLFEAIDILEGVGRYKHKSFLKSYRDRFHRSDYLDKYC